MESEPSPRQGCLACAARIVLLASAFLSPLIGPARADTSTTFEPESGYLADPTASVVRILPSGRELHLDTVPEHARGQPQALPPLTGTFHFDVESPLPAWTVRAVLGAVNGPEGPLPAGSLELSLEAAEVQIQRENSSTLLVSGRGPAPARALPLSITLNAQWSEAPGAYAGELQLMPVMPQAMMGGSSPVLVIPVHFEIPPTIMVSAVEGEYQLQGGTGLGRFTLEPDIPVLIASNMDRWEVRLEGSPFRCGDSEVPLDRIAWAWLDADCEPQAWTSLGASNLLLSGRQGRGVFTETLRLSLFVELSDRAGEYRSQIRLTGAGGG